MHHRAFWATLVVAIVALTVWSLSGALLRASDAPATPATASAMVVPAASATLAMAFPAIDPKVLQFALSAVSCAREAVDVAKPSLLTLIDYSRPSTEPRLWVLDLDQRRVLHEELVAHGRGSGENEATRFSNDPGSHQSSLGLFVTESAYVGRNGYSLRLMGLEPGFNHLALQRAIVIHGAQYVSEAIVRAMGRLGRSFGCPALRPAVAREVIDRIKGGSFVFAYYPNERWLQSSRFLGACRASASAPAP